MRSCAALLLVLSGCATTPLTKAEEPVTLTFAWPVPSRYSVRRVQENRLADITGATSVTRGEMRFIESVTMSTLDRTRRIEMQDVTVEPGSNDAFRRMAVLSEVTTLVSPEGETLGVEQSREAMERGLSILMAPKSMAERMAPMLAQQREKDVRTHWRDLVGLWNGRVITGAQTLKWASEDPKDLLTELTLEAERNAPCGAAKCVRLHAVLSEPEAQREATRVKAEQSLQKKLTGELKLSRVVAQYDVVLVTDPATLVPSSLTSNRVINFVGTLDGKPVTYGEERRTELTWQREE